MKEKSYLGNQRISNGELGKCKAGYRELTNADYSQTEKW